MVARLVTLGEQIRSRVLDVMCASAPEDLARPGPTRGGDVIYALDARVEEIVTAAMEMWARETPFLLVMEGLPGGAAMWPPSAPRSAAAFTLVVDPIDGTRGLMYGKRSGWALFGVAPAPHEALPARLSDIQIAVQVELPTPRAALADVLWATAGRGLHAETVDLQTGERRPYVPLPSTAETLDGGFASVVKFFPGIKRHAVEIEERLFSSLMGETPTVFDDEYIATGGQLYELLTGKDRFVADLRPLARVTPQVLCAHPYDLCTWIIAGEAGVVITGVDGAPLDAPLDVQTPVGWIGYANDTLRGTIEPVLLPLLATRQR